MSKQTIKFRNMSSTEIFKIQAENIYEKLRYENTQVDPDVVFIPTHLGGVDGQTDVIDSRSVMRITKVTQ